MFNKTRIHAFGAIALVIAATAVGGYFYMDKAQANEANAANAANVANAANAANATAPAAGNSTKKLSDIVKPDTVYATIDDQKITGKDVLEQVKTLPPAFQEAPADKLLQLVVDQMVNQRLVAMAASEAKIAEDAETQKRLAAAKEQVIVTRYLEKALEGRVTDKRLKEKYDEIVKATPPQDEIRASHILVSDEKTAKDIIARLNKGEDFAKLAKEYSTDATKENGGDLGYFVRPAMVKEFGDAVFAMKKGDVTKTPVKTQFGWHVIKVVDRRTQKAPDFEVVKEKLKAQVTEEEARKIIQSLRDKKKVEINLPQS